MNCCIIVLGKFVKVFITVKLYTPKFVKYEGNEIIYIDKDSNYFNCLKHFCECNNYPSGIF